MYFRVNRNERWQVKLNRFKKSGDHAHGEVELPLAPMASVFTVILVFLIKSASMSVTSITPAGDIDLPEVTQVSEIPDSLKVQISSQAIIVGEKVIMNLDHFNPISRSPASNDEVSFKEVEKALEFEKGESLKDQNTKLVIIADKKAPYQILKKILTSAANVGLLDLKLVVIGGE